MLHQQGIHPKLAKRKGLERADFFALQRLLRQYLYACTSKASTLSTDISTHARARGFLRPAAPQVSVSVLLYQ